MQNLMAGRRSFRFSRPPVIRAWASVAGKKEGQGPLGREFDYVSRDPYFGRKTWEQGETALQQLTLTHLLRKADLQARDLDLVLSGDLLNQCTASAFCLRGTGIPHLGLYGACSTMAQALLLGAMAAGGGYVRNAVAMTSSHFCAAERQYRLPLGYGGQRTPTAQWTVTGAGAALILPEGKGPKITACTLGTVTDLGIRDPSNMGAAMAAAALDTIKVHLQNLHRSPQDFDLIVTGDLGQIGKELLLELGGREGLLLGGPLADSGCMIFDNTRQAVGAGGSGAGCSAAVLCSRLLNQLEAGALHRILFCGTGALLSPLTTQQGLPIPGICHAVEIEGGIPQCSI